MEEKKALGRDALVSRLRKGTLNVERERDITVKAYELAPLHQRIDIRCRRNMEENIGSWVEAKNDDSVVKD